MTALQAVASDPNHPADPLEAVVTPERVNYATGVMLQAEDFLAEQTYHRGRLAQLTRHLLGFGTLSGLRVVAPPAQNNILELRVEPGIAVDRYGRLVEINNAQCIELARWFAAQDQRRLKTATHNTSVTPLDVAIVIDVFLGAKSCGRGKTPSIASGPFDALDALVAARVAENPELTLVLRSEGNPDPDRDPADGPPPAAIPNPTNFWPAPNANAQVKLNAVLGSWDTGASDSLDNRLSPMAEHVLGSDPSAVLLARVAIPVTVGADEDGETRTTIDFGKTVSVDNALRPIIYFQGKWLGRAPTPPATV